MKETIDNTPTDNQCVKTDSVQGNDNPSVELTGNENKTVESIPYARFNEVTKQKKELETKLKEFEAKQGKNKGSIKKLILNLILDCKNTKINKMFMQKKKLRKGRVC